MQNAPLPTHSDSKENTYRWPQKVHRYGLMQHPFLRLFVALFENQVPWNTRPQGWNAESLREHIRTHMLPALEPVDPRIAAQTAFGAAYYIDCINLDAALQEAADRKLERLRKMRELNPSVAERATIRHFNQQKYKAFQSWWDMMQRHFSGRPEWIYCLLRRVFATSTRDSRAPVPAVRLKTVRKVADAIIRGEVLPSVGLANAYLRYEAALDDASSKFHPNGWTRVEREPENENPSKTSLLSYFGTRAGWCIRNRDTASDYLQDSDFYVLCSGGSPVVAVRIGERASRTGPTLEVREVTGIRNRRVKEYPAVDLLIAVLLGAKAPLQSGDLRTGSRLSSLDSDGWSRVLETVPFAIRYAPEQVRKSGAIREKVQSALLRYIHRDAFWGQFLFRMNAGATPLTPATELLLDATLRTTAVPVTLSVRWIFRHANLRAAWEAGWIQRLKATATTCGVPRRILCSPENRPLALAAMRRDLEAGRPVPLHGLELQDPGLFEAWRRSWLRLLDSPAPAHSAVPARLSDDRQIAAAWVLNHSRAALKGNAPASAPHGGILFAGWCGLWISALKALFKGKALNLRKLFIPKILRRNPAIRRTFLEGWIGYLKGRATTVGVPRRILGLAEIRPLTLDAFRIDLDCQQRPPHFHPFYAEEPGLWNAWTQAWVRYLNEAPRPATELPPELVRDKKILSAWFGSHLKKCRLGELVWHAAAGGIPASMWRALQIVNAKALFVKNNLSLRGLAVPKSLRKNPGIRRAFLQAWIGRLQSPGTTIGVPRRVLAMQEVRPLALTAFRRDLGRNQQPPPFHAFYAEEPGLREAWHQAWTRHLRQAPRPAAEVPAELLAEKEILSAWFSSHLNVCRRGELPPDAPAGCLRHSLWRALWLVSVKAIFSNPGDSACHVKIPSGLLKLRAMQRVLTRGWLGALEKKMREDCPGYNYFASERLFFQLLTQVCEGLKSPQALRDFVLGYLRLAARWKQFPFFNSHGIPNTGHCGNKPKLSDFEKDVEFQCLWIQATIAATLNENTEYARRRTWTPFRMPSGIGEHPEVRTAAREACIAFLGRFGAVGSSKLPQGITNPAREYSHSNPERTGQTPAMRSAEDTALAFFERLALGENLDGIDTPPEAIAGDLEARREWAELWPKRVAARLNVEALQLAAACGEIGLPDELWNSNSGQQPKKPWVVSLLRELLLRFLSTRDAGRPLANNDSPPALLAGDPEALEGWVSAWERVLHAMPGEYAAFRNVALNVQHSPRVFRAWLQAVGPLNRLREEEEGWRMFLLLNGRDVFPPFLPRAEIWQNSAKLRGIVREGLNLSSVYHAADGDDFVARGMNARRNANADRQAGDAVSLPENAAVFRAALAPAREAGNPGPIDSEDAALLTKASDALRAAPWVLESLPPEYAKTRFFLEAALSGWEAYLGVAPWLLPSIPAACRPHFQKTRAGVKRTAPVPAPPARDKTLSTAA